MKIIRNILWGTIGLLCSLSQANSAAPGNFFEVTSSGAPANLSLTLCLNGTKRISCQNYTVTHLTLRIRTLIPNHVYPAAGIIINTPGYSAADIGCTPAANGLCIFSVSATTPQTVPIVAVDGSLYPLTQNLALSINSPGADPALAGNPRIIRIQNTRSIAATNLQVNTSVFPSGTSITANTCTGTLNPGASCDITITPGSNASLNGSSTACTTTPGTAPVPSTVTVSADNESPININVLILGYGCIYQGGFLFAVNDSTPSIQSIGGKVAALMNEPSEDLQWATLFNNTPANSTTNGFANTHALTSPAGQYPVAQACLNKSEQGFTDWYVPAVCELARYSQGVDIAGCGNTNPNLYSTLAFNNLGDLGTLGYWSSTQFSGNPIYDAWGSGFLNEATTNLVKTNSGNAWIRCIRIFAP